MQHDESNPGRRRFLRRAGGTAAALTLLGAGGVGAMSTAAVGGDGEAYAYWRRKAKGAMSDLEYIVMCGTLAPSPHNTQPWTFRMLAPTTGSADGGGIEIRADLARHLGPADAQHRMMQIAIGCAMENMRVAAERLGYTMRVESLDAGPDFARRGGGARLRFVRAGVIEHPWFDALFARQTTRTAFAMTQPSAALRQRLEAPQPDLPGIGLRWLTLGPDTDRLGRIVGGSVRAFLSPQRHSAGMRWFRISREEWEQERDGIAVFNNDAPRFAKQYVDWFVKPADLLGEDFRRAEIDTMDRVAPATPLWGLVHADSVSPAARILGGRMAERVYLEATARGYAVQPICYPTEVPEAARQLAALAGLKPGAEPLFLFRVGESGHVGKSVRRDLREVIVA